MTKQLSEHARAAKLIRAELKKHNIKGIIRASIYAGGDSVNVSLTNCEAPWTVEAITKFCNQFQMGHFDGMIDCYEYSNRNDDLPQVKFVFIANGRSDADRQRAWDYLRNNFGGYEDAPTSFEDAGSFRANDQWADSAIHQVLNGSMDARSCGIQFWHKSVISAPRV